MNVSDLASAEELNSVRGNLEDMDSPLVDDVPPETVEEARRRADRAMLLAGRVLEEGAKTERKLAIAVAALKRYAEPMDGRDNTAINALAEIGALDSARVYKAYVPDEMPPGEMIFSPPQVSDKKPSWGKS